MLIDQNFLSANLEYALAGVDLRWLGKGTRGKVRDLYTVDDRIIMITTDRLSAFDQILGLVPCKGQVLNELALFWFDQTRDIIPNAVLESPDPNVTVVRRCTPLLVEVVVRGYITGVTSTALWQRYSQGERTIYGIDFPNGLQKNDPLPVPIITPTTKAADGGHDARITSAEVVTMGLATAAQWEEISAAAVALFTRGQEIAARSGLILVDTKYEFGLLPNGRVALIDEIHTPDSSRFWEAATWPERRAAGLEPENFDKEFVRLYYAAHGYQGEGAPFPLPAELAVEAAERYIRAYERITHLPFMPAAMPAAPRIEANLRRWATSQGIAQRIPGGGQGESNGH
jgi:phosphoribosylaminoimidazole-succinocarboxamide synthase